MSIAPRPRSYAIKPPTSGTRLDERIRQVNDVEIVKAVAPRIVPGGQLLILSTPWLEQGVLYDQWRTNFGVPTTALVAHAPTLLMRDDEHTRSFVEREYQRDPDTAARELGAQFMGGGASTLIDPASITAAVDESRPLVSFAVSGNIVAAGADLALVNDASALALVARDGERFEVLELAERRPAKGVPLKLSEVIDDFAVVLKRHKHERFTTDGHLRETAREFCERHGLIVEDAPAGAGGNWDVYSLLAKVFREGRITMARNPRLEAQLRAVVAKPLPGGGYRIHSPRRAGSHGDLVSALALAVWKASQSYASRGMSVSSARSRWGDAGWNTPWGRGF